MNIKTKQIAAISLALAITSTIPMHGVAEEEKKKQDYHCFTVDEVLKVVDGDTLDVRVKLLPFPLLTDVRIRMQGIDTWETRTRNAEEKKKGLAAKQRLIELTAKNILACLTKRDKYGRWLGVLYSGKVNLNRQMLREGHAYEYDGGKRREFE